MAQQLIGRTSRVRVAGDADARPTVTITYPDGSEDDISAFAIHREAIPDADRSAGYPARWECVTPEFTATGRHTVTVDGVAHHIDVFSGPTTPLVALNGEEPRAGARDPNIPPQED